MEPRTARTPNKKMNMRQAAEYVGRSVGTIRNWICNGDHPRFVKEMGRVYMWTHDIDAWLQTKNEIFEANVRPFGRKAS